MNAERKNPDPLKKDQYGQRTVPPRPFQNTASESGMRDNRNNRAERSGRAVRENQPAEKSPIQQNISVGHRRERLKNTSAENRSRGSDIKNTDAIPAEGQRLPRQREPHRTGELTQYTDGGVVHQEKTVKRVKSGFDRILIVVVVILLGLGAIMVFSASYAWANYQYDDSFYWVKKHVAWVVLGLLVMFCAMSFDYRVYKKLAPPIFVVSYLLLAAVPVVGKVVNGAKRWIVIGPIQIQPSEIMKFSLVLFLAYYMSKYVIAARDIGNVSPTEKQPYFKRSSKERFYVFIREVFIPFAIVGLVCGTTVLEKHMSATIILFLIGMVVIYLGKVSVFWISGLGIVGASAATYIILFTDYTKDRIDAWLHPENYTQTSGWQTLNSLMAIGSGGLFGVGIGNSNQKQMYLPEPQNDFIFAIICEELGFIGALGVIALFGVLIWRGISIASKAPDSFSSLVAAGITAKIAIQAILNIAVVTNTIPNTGISLPFLSYGGSALILLMAEIGVLLSISRYSYQNK